MTSPQYRVLGLALSVGSPLGLNLSQTVIKAAKPDFEKSDSEAVIAFPFYEITEIEPAVSDVDINAEVASGLASDLEQRLNSEATDGWSFLASRVVTVRGYGSSETQVLLVILQRLA